MGISRRTFVKTAGTAASGSTPAAALARVSGNVDRDAFNGGLTGRNNLRLP